MGEEIRDTEVKIWHMRFAKTIRVPENVLAVMGKMQDDLKRMWLLLCAMDGMDITEEEASLTIPEIQEKRNAYLKEKHNAAMTDIEKEVEQLKRDVRRELEESRAVRSSVEDGIEAALKEQAATQKKLVEAKDEMIAMLRHQVEELERRKIALQAEAMDSLAAAKREEEQRAEEERRAEGGQRAEEEAQRSAQGNRQKLLLRILSYFRRNREADKFIDAYLKDERMSDEQREFLLGCLEEGTSIKDIEAIASPHLSIEIMSRLMEYRKGGSENERP